MDRTNSAFVLAYYIVCALGALACILVWFGIKPGDIRAMTITLPRFFWLIAALLLFTASLWSSIRAWKSQGTKSEIERLTNEVSKLEEELRLTTNEKTASLRSLQELKAQLDEARQNLSLVPPTSLQGKVLQLARDIAAFLRELGPAPVVDVHPGMTTEEILRLNADGDRPERVHHGYMRRFRDRAVNLIHELAEKGVTDTGIENYQVDPLEIQRERELRDLVRNCSSWRRYRNKARNRRRPQARVGP